MQRSRTRSRTPDASPGVGEPRVSAPRAGLQPRAAPAESAPRAEAAAAGAYALGGKPRAAERVRPAEPCARTRVHVPGCVAGTRAPRRADGSTPAPGRGGCWRLLPASPLSFLLGQPPVAQAPSQGLRRPRWTPASRRPRPRGGTCAAARLPWGLGGRRGRRGRCRVGPASAAGSAGPRTAPAQPRALLPPPRRAAAGRGSRRRGSAHTRVPAPRPARPDGQTRPPPRLLGAARKPAGDAQRGAAGRGRGQRGASARFPGSPKGLQGNCSRNVRLRSSFSGATIGYIKNNS